MSYRLVFRAGFFSIALQVLAGVGYCDTATPDAVYDYLRWNCKISKSGYELRVRRKVTLYNQRADMFQHIRISENEFVKLKDVSVRVTDAEGQEIFLHNKKDMLKSCGYEGYSLYQDICNYLLTVEAPKYPFSIEIEYLKKSKSLFFWGGASFQQKIPVQSAAYELQAPAKVAFRYRMRGADISPQVDTQKNVITYLWRQDSIPAYDPVDYAPPGYDEPIGIIFVPERLAMKKYRLESCTWANIGNWYAKMASKKYLRHKGAVDTDSPTPTLAEAESAYKNVTDAIRYVAIQIGVGGWQPYDASLTKERGYGDCKDMSTLLISELKSNGVQSYPALVRTKNLGPIDPNFPELRFNHVITVSIADGDTLWMDPTCGDCPFGELPPTDEDIDVLVVTDSGGEIWRTNPSKSVDNTISRITHYTIGADMRGRFVTNLTFRGNFAIEIRSVLARLDADGRRRAVDEIFAGAGKQFRVDSFLISDLSDKGKPIQIQIHATMNRRERNIGGTVYCNPLMFAKLSRRESVDVTGRTAPLYLRYPSIIEDAITLAWDSSLHVDSVSVPDDDSLSFSFGAFVHTSTSFSQDVDSVSVSIRKERSAYTVYPADFPNYASYQSAVDKLVNGHLKLYLQSSNR